MDTTAATTATAAETVTVALNKLKPSPANVRRTGADGGISELAANIAAIGLLQPLVVEPERDADGGETGNYLVEAGERRRKALRLLAKQKRIRRTEPIPCVLRRDGRAAEISLAENFHQCPMHPADQFEAFKGLAEQEGMSIEDIAARFGISPTVVRQRLKLGAVSPKLLALYREGALNLEQLMAFCITDDHGLQEEAWAQLAWNKSPEMIRKLLTQSHVSPRDRRARFIGTEAYEAAGGVILRDLFGDDYGGYFTDSQLLDRLVLAKLEAAADEVLADGWKWVEVYLEYPYALAHGMRRVYPEPAPLSAEEQAPVDGLKADYEALQAEHAGDREPPEEAVARLEELAEQIAAAEGRSAYRPDDVRRAGAMVTLDPEGMLRIERGLVRRQDEDPEPAADQPADAEAGTDRSATPGAPSLPADEQGDGLKPLPDKLVVELTAYRTAALQECLAARPDVALIAVVHALALRALHPARHDADTCLAIELQPVGLHAAPGIGESKAAQAMAARHQEWGRRLPRESADLWAWLLAQSGETHLALLAYCCVRSINAVHEPWNRAPRRLLHADLLAQALSLDMAAWWEPTKAGYLARVSKARILEAVREAASAQAAESIAGMKKDAMAEQAERLLAGSGWLPEVLRGPAPEASVSAPDPAVPLDD